MKAPLSGLVALGLALLGAPTGSLAEDYCDALCAEGLSPTGDLAPKAGQEAPSFLALSFDPEIGHTEEHSLEALLTDRPLILAFGSYT